MAGSVPLRRTIGLVPLPEEVIVTLVVNENPIARLSCSPYSLRELGVGWLYSQQIIDSLADIDRTAVMDGSRQVEIWVNESARERLLDFVPVTACAGGVTRRAIIDELGPLSREYALDADQLKTAMNALLDNEHLYLRHGGVHCAMLADVQSFVPAVIMEDIGRSNAIDKVVGWGLENHLDLSAHILFVTGRITSEMVLKAHRARIATVVSLTTMSSQAYEIALSTGQTLVAHVLKPRPILVNF